MPMSFHTFFSTRVNKTDEARKIVTQKTLCNQRGCSVHVAFLSTVVFWGIVKYVVYFLTIGNVQFMLHFFVTNYIINSV